ncbi:DUF3533 domain-containing protein [Nocardioides koreensis]|uniref:DUF3533 domain-containing protein n=1 Tax=Nocardioides koreensis TaxID=433651 RepID=A0ABN2ZHQ9_9ACTN
MTQSRYAAVVAEVRDAVSARTVGLVAGVLLVQLAFIGSYVGAFHDPVPHQIPVAVAGAHATRTADGLVGLDGRPLDTSVTGSATEARRQVEHGDVAAALVISGSSKHDTLYVASGGGVSLATAVGEVVDKAEQSQGRSVATTDLVPLAEGDARGLTGFYLVIGWLVGGYLVSSMLGIARGARPATRGRALVRLAALVPYAVLSGLGGALLVDPVMDALPGHFWALGGLGVLLVLSSATVTMALQVLFGAVGIGLTVLLFVVLGNPSAGGAYQGEMLPGLWRTIGPWLPNGAGTSSVRELVYLGGDVSGQLLVVTAYVVLGAVVALVAAPATVGPRHAASRGSRAGQA